MYTFDDHLHDNDDEDGEEYTHQLLKKWHDSHNTTIYRIKIAGDRTRNSDKAVCSNEDVTEWVRRHGREGGVLEFRKKKIEKYIIEKK